MTITLQKRANLSLTKTDTSLDLALIGLEWDARISDGKPFDLDASAFLLDKNGRVRNNSDFCFYNQQNVTNGVIEHQGHNLTRNGDNEQIKISQNRNYGNYS